MFRRVAIPIERLERADDEGLALSVSTTEALAFAAPPQDNAEAPAASLGPRTIVAVDGLSLRLKGLRASQKPYLITHLVVLEPSEDTLLLPASRITELGSRQILTSVGCSDLDSLPIYRLDEDIEDDLWEALYASEDISEIDLRRMAARVRNSLVTLEGNVRTPSAVGVAEDVARSVEGVEAVSNRLVSDWDIDLEVASAIAKAAPALSGSVAVHSQLGRVFLEGYAPSAEARAQVVQAIPPFPGVWAIEDDLLIRPPAPKPAPPNPEAASEAEEAAR